jgi:hypothetical protein
MYAFCLPLAVSPAQEVKKMHEMKRENSARKGDKEKQKR